MLTADGQAEADRGISIGDLGHLLTYLGPSAVRTQLCRAAWPILGTAKPGGLKTSCGSLVSPNMLLRAHGQHLIQTTAEAYPKG